MLHLLLNKIIYDGKINLVVVLIIDYTNDTDIRLMNCSQYKALKWKMNQLANYSSAKVIESRIPTFSTFKIIT